MIYFDVAIEKDKNGNEKTTVYNDHNLTTEKCYSEGIAYLAPDKSYLRLKETTDPANYITYFMQNTTTTAYMASRLAVKAGQTVYFEPKDKKYVALVVTPVTPAPAYYPDDYYYVEDVDLRLGNSSTVWDERGIWIQAELVNVYTGVHSTEYLDCLVGEIYTDIPYKAANDTELTTPVYIPHVVRVAGNYLDQPIPLKVTSVNSPDNNPYVTVDDVNTFVADFYNWKGIQYSRGTDGYYFIKLTDYNIGPYYFTNDLGVWKIKPSQIGNFYGMPVPGIVYLEDGSERTVDTWYAMKDFDDYNNNGYTDEPRLDDQFGNPYATQHNPILFTVVKDGHGKETLVVYDYYKSWGIWDGLNNKWIKGTDRPEVVVPENLSPAYRGVEPEDFTMDNAAHEYLQTGQYDYGTIGNQFVRMDTLTDKSFLIDLINKGFLIDGEYDFSLNGNVYKIFDYNVPKTNDPINKDYAYDDDTSHSFDITSGIFKLHETSERAYVETLKPGTKVLTATGYEQYNYAVDPVVYVTEDTKVIAYEWDSTHREVTHRSVYNYNQFERMGYVDNGRFIDGDYHALVVTIPVTGVSPDDDDKTPVVDYEQACYIVLITNEIVDHDYVQDAGEYFGIYCGYDEISATEVELYFISPYDNGKVQSYKVPSSMVPDRKYVGYVLRISTSAGAVTGVHLAQYPGVVLTQNTNSITVEFYEQYADSAEFKKDASGDFISQINTKSLLDATYYYVDFVGGNHVSEVKASFINRDKHCVGIYEDANKKTMIVIWDKNVLQGLKDGTPITNNVDENWL